VPVKNDIVAMGEIGLSGELRQIGSIDIRVSEAARLGFKKIVLPHKNTVSIKDAKIPKDVELIYVKSIFDALDLIV